LLSDTAEIDRILRDGASRARAIAAPIMEDVKRVVGFVV
jgi:tryptophanyl-tRNA synthetase